jgi:DNA/RNA-binding domain of Phe-tRNA-synthetase-like protein
MRDVVNPQHHPLLDERKQQLENELRTRFMGYDRPSLKAFPVLASYSEYYKQFKKTYHVQHQLESLVFKSKSIPQVAALVEAMFMAELKNLLLTAGHDLDMVEPPVRIIVAEGTESYIRMSGEQQVAKAGDMMIADTKGILSSIIHGPDQRTHIRPETRHVMFTVYATPGIKEEMVYRHLEDLRENVRLVAPDASVEISQVFGSE